MPKCLDPNDVNELHLASDAHLPAESRPTFLARFVSVATFNQICDVLDKMDGAAMSGAQVNDELFGWLKKYITGWRNMNGSDGKAIPFSTDALRSAITFTEGIELLMLIAGFAPRPVEVQAPEPAQA